MKSIFLLFVMTATSWFPAYASAASGQYVCADTGDDMTAKAIAATLNKLGCDVTKPTTPLTFGNTTYIVVCCVQK